jgi:hypothetical protein
MIMQIEDRTNMRRRLDGSKLDECTIKDLLVPNLPE